MDNALAHRAQATFALLGSTVFPMHGPLNSRLDLEVVDTGIAGDTRTFIVVLPWCFEGLIISADDRFPTSLVLAGRRLHVDHHELPDPRRRRSRQAGTLRGLADERRPVARRTLIAVSVGVAMVAGAFAASLIIRATKDEMRKKV